MGQPVSHQHQTAQTMRESDTRQGPEHCSVTGAARAPFTPQQGRDAAQHHILTYRDPYHTLSFKKFHFYFQSSFFCITTQQSRYPPNPVYPPQEITLPALSSSEVYLFSVQGKVQILDLGLVGLCEKRPDACVCLEQRMAVSHKSTWQAVLNQVLPGDPHSVATRPSPWPVRCCSCGAPE